VDEREIAEMAKKGKGPNPRKVSAYRRRNEKERFGECEGHGRASKAYDVPVCC